MIGIALSEFTLAFLAPQPVYRTLLKQNLAMHIEGDVLPHVLKPDYAGRFIREEFDTTVTINSHGFRGREFRNRNEPRIVIIGDSFTFGHGVNDDQTYPALLDKHFKDSEVINAGFVAGSSPDMYFAWLQKHGAELGASEIIIGFFIGNDIDRHPQMVWVKTDSKGLPVKIENVESHVVNGYLRPRVTPIGYRYPILRESHLFHLAGRAFRQLQSFIKPATKPASVFDDHNQPETIKKIEKTKRVFLGINNWMQANKISFSVIMIPTLQQVTKKHNNKIQKLFSKFFTEHKINHFDLLHGMSLVNKSLYFPIDQHWNVEGHKIAAQLIADWVEKKMNDITPLVNPPTILQ